MFRLRRRAELQYLGHPNIAYTLTNDTDLSIMRSKDAGKAIAEAARDFAKRRPDLRFFTMLVDMPGSKADVRRIGRQLNAYASTAVFVSGCAYQIDDDHLGIRVMFEVR